MAEQKIVLDSSIVLLYLAGDIRVEQLVNRAIDGAVDAFLIKQCLTEVYDKLNGKFGVGEANKILDAIKNSKIRIVDVDYELIRNAGEIRTSHKWKISMVAAYMLAYAKKIGATVVTSDEKIAKTEDVRVEYFKIKTS